MDTDKTNGVGDTVTLTEVLYPNAWSRAWGSARAGVVFVSQNLGVPWSLTEDFLLGS